MPTKKQLLGERLVHFPLLRLLLFEAWFRYVFIALVILGVCGGLFLSKIWRVTPEDGPLKRISGLDLMQSWSLKRAALRAEEQNDLDSAAYSWITAVANHPGDTELVSGFLKAYLKNPHPERRYHQTALSQSRWLLFLTRTNETPAIELATQVFERLGAESLAIELIEPRLPDLTPTLHSVFLKSLFKQGKMHEFATHWREASAHVAEDPELRLYWLTYLGGWGPQESAENARTELAGTLDDPQWAVTASRLSLALASRRNDLELYQSTLEFLQTWNADTLAHHVGLWRLLARNERTAQARQLATTFPRNPASVAEVTSLAQLYLELEMQAEALSFLRRSIAEFNSSADLWLVYAIQLLNAKQLSDLRQAALNMRDNEFLGTQLAGYSQYFEGLALNALSKPAEAQQAFESLRRWEFKDPQVAFVIARHLHRLDYAEFSRDILLGLESVFEDKTEYWTALFAAADKLKQTDLMLRASTRAYDLAPENVMILNNHAATLLITRQRPDEAIRLTLSLMSYANRSIPSRVNHSAALLMNERLDEAEALLKTVSPSVLTEEQASLYHLDLFETYLRQGRLAEAQSEFDRINPDHLYPPQQVWLEEARHQLTSSEEQPAVL